MSGRSNAATSHSRWGLRKLSWATVVLVLAMLALAVTAAGCGSSTTTAAATSTSASADSSASTTSPASSTTTEAQAKKDIILASTTSTQDSGLFDVLLPAFEKAYPQYTVKVVAVGSGEAIKLGQNKDADVLLVHSPAAEKKFVEEGYGTERRLVMYNDFIIVGPALDPAGIKGMTVAADAFGKIAETQSTFLSRGDESGTHTKELAIWKESGIEEPSGAWYEATGQGMGPTLTIASEKAAYTLADRATYLKQKANLQLEILCEGDKILFNQYGVIPVVDATNQQGANDFADWICSEEGQTVVKTYGVEEFGQPLFVPNAE